MADRYWVGGSGTWSTTNTANWSAASGILFGASCSGTTLTTDPTPGLAIGMTVWVGSNVNLGTITSGSDTTWTVSVGGTYSYQQMIAATTGASVPTVADNVFFDLNSSLVPLTVTMSGALACKDFTNTKITSFAGSGTRNISGSFTLAIGSRNSGTGTITFTSTTTGKTITTNGASLSCGVVFNGSGGGWTLGSALTLSGTLTIQAGTLDTSASNYSVAANGLIASGTTTRGLNMNGSTFTTAGGITFSGTNLSLSIGTSTIVSTSYISAITSTYPLYNVTISSGSSGSITTAANINVSTITNNLSIARGASERTHTIIFTTACSIGTLTSGTGTALTRILLRSSIFGTPVSVSVTNPVTISYVDFMDISFTGTLSGTSYGDGKGNTGLTFTDPKTVYWTGSNVSFGSGWATTAAGTPSTDNFPLAQDTLVFTNTSGGTITNLYGPFLLGNIDASGRTLTLSLTSLFYAPFYLGDVSIGTGMASAYLGTYGTYIGRTLQNVTIAPVVTLSISVTVNINGTIVRLQNDITGLNATRTWILAAGTLDLNGYSLNASTFTSNSSATRTLAFGSTGSITVTGTGTVWNTSTVTGLTITGTPTVNISNPSATATTVSPGALSEASSIDFNFTTGTYTLTMTGSSRWGNLDFTGFSGSVVNATQTIYGNLTLSPTATYSAGVNTWTFASTSGVKTITANGELVDFSLTFNGIGGGWQLQDALTMGTTRVLTQTNGTLDLNGKTLTVGAYFTAIGTKNLTFNGGTLVCPTGGTTFNNVQPTGFTTTAGTGIGYISMPGSTAKAFAGNGSVFNCTLQQSGTGDLTITGSNTFDDIQNTVNPATIIFTAGTTTTFLTGFSLIGTPGNLTTVKSSVTSSKATISKPNGIVASDYLSITDSTATGGAAWYAGTNSVDNGNNTGWVFASAPMPLVITSGVTIGPGVTIISS